MSLSINIGRPILNDKTLDEQARSVLRLYGTNAHVYLPGAGGVAVSGLLTNNYTLSNGSTGYSAVDGTTGLVLDAAGSVGAELVTNGTNLVTTTGWTANGGATLSVVSGALRVTNGTAAFGFAAQSFATVIGQTYYIPPFYVGANPANTVNYHIGAAPGGATDVTGANAALPKFFVASQTTSYISVYAGSNTIANYTDYNNISVKQVTGIHATQTTTANKPAERRGLYNLLTYSQDFSNAVWTKTNATPSGSIVTTTATNHTLRNQYSVTPGQTYTIGIKAKRGTMTDAKVGAYDAIGAATILSSSYYAEINAGDYAIVARTVTAPAGCTNLFVYALLDSGVTGTIDIAGVGLFTGTLSASDIIREGGIPLTTSTAASNSGAGRYSWQFDGVNDSLALGSVPFQMSDDHCVISAIAPNNTSAQVIFSENGGLNPRLQLYTVGGNLICDWQDDAATLSSAVVAGGGAVGVMQVVSMRKVGNTKQVRKNGGAPNVSNTALGATTLSTAKIGINSVTGVDANWVNGSIGPVVVIKGTISDSDLLTLERWVASQTVGGPSF